MKQMMKIYLYGLSSCTNHYDCSMTKRIVRSMTDEDVLSFNNISSCSGKNNLGVEVYFEVSRSRGRCFK